MQVKTTSSGRQPIAHSARAPISPYVSRSRRVQPTRKAGPVDPAVAWTRTIDSSGAHWLAPSTSPSPCESASSIFSMNGTSARSATERISSGFTPAVSSLAARNGLVRWLYAICAARRFDSNARTDAGAIVSTDSFQKRPPTGTIGEALLLRGTEGGDQLLLRHLRAARDTCRLRTPVQLLLAQPRQLVGVGFSVAGGLGGCSGWACACLQPPSQQRRAASQQRRAGCTDSEAECDRGDRPALAAPHPRGGSLGSEMRATAAPTCSASPSAATSAW